MVKTEIKTLAKQLNSKIFKNFSFHHSIWKSKLRNISQTKIKIVKCHAQMESSICFCFVIIFDCNQITYNLFKKYILRFELLLTNWGLSQNSDNCRHALFQRQRQYGLLVFTSGWVESEGFGLDRRYTSVWPCWWQPCGWSLVLSMPQVFEIFHKL